MWLVLSDDDGPGIEEHVFEEVDEVLNWLPPALDDFRDDAADWMDDSEPGNALCLRCPIGWKCNVYIIRINEFEGGWA